MSTLRLWHQSSTQLDNPTYRDMILRHAARVVPEAQIDLHGVIYPEGEQYRTARHCAYAQMLTDVQCAQNIIQAEREGYDAFVSTCFNDPGIMEGRSVVDIPVVGFCETSVLTAQTLGRGIGIVGASRSQTNRVAKTLHRARLTSRVVALVSMSKPWVGGFSGDGEDGGQSVIDSFTDGARTAIAQGADVLIAGEGPVSILLAERGIHEIDGVRVLDSWAVVVKQAQMLVELRRSAGAGILPSRSNEYYAVPAEVVAELARTTADVLRDGWVDHAATSAHA